MAPKAHETPKVKDDSKPTPFGVLLNRLLEEAGWSPTAIERAGGLSKSHIYRYSSGELRSKPYDSTLRKLSDVTSLPFEVLKSVTLGTTDPMTVRLPPPHGEVQQWVSNASVAEHCAYVPRYKAGVAAGGWAQVDEFELEQQEDRHLLPKDPAEFRRLRAMQIDQGLVRLYVAGDSMTDSRPGKLSFPDGTLVEFRYLRLDTDPLHRYISKPVYVQLSDGRATFKILESMGEQFTLRAINRKYPEPLTFAADDLSRVAVITYILQDPMRH